MFEAMKIRFMLRPLRMYHAVCQDASNILSREMYWILSEPFTPMDNESKGQRSVWVVGSSVWRTGIICENWGVICRQSITSCHDNHVSVTLCHWNYHVLCHYCTMLYNETICITSGCFTAAIHQTFLQTTGQQIRDRRGKSEDVPPIFEFASLDTSDNAGFWWHLSKPAGNPSHFCLKMGLSWARQLV